MDSCQVPVCFSVRFQHFHSNLIIFSDFSDCFNAGNWSDSLLNRLLISSGSLSVDYCSVSFDSHIKICFIIAGYGFDPAVTWCIPASHRRVAKKQTNKQPHKINKTKQNQLIFFKSTRFKREPRRNRVRQRLWSWRLSSAVETHHLSIGKSPNFPFEAAGNRTEIGWWKLAGGNWHSVWNQHIRYGFSMLGSVRSEIEDGGTTVL